MPYSIVSNDVVEVVVTSEIDSQKILNVFHYKANIGGTAVTDGDAWLQTFLTRFQSHVMFPVGTTWRGGVVNTFTFLEVKAQVVWPTRQVYTRQFIVSEGTIDETAAPPCNQITMSLRTDTVGRGKTGNKKFCGLPGFWQDAAEWVPTAIEYYSNMMGQFRASVIPDIATPLNFGTPIVWSPRKPTDRRTIIDSIVRPEVRVEPSRRKGQGI